MASSFGQLARARIDELRGAGKRNAISLEAIATKAIISRRTLEKWKSGEIPNPPDDTVIAVFCAAGLGEAAAREEVRRLREKASLQKLPAGGPPNAPFNGERASKDQPRLSGPPDVQRLSHYTRRALDVVGRDAEMDRLRRFVEADHPFCWLQLAGVAGQGKSRLALELMLELGASGWLAGFLNDDEVAELGGGWHRWQPSRPTLLIVDYVVGRGRSVGPIFRQLARRGQELRLPVRLLLVERQRWDRGGAPGVRIAEAPVPGSRADWFVALTERHDGADGALSQSRFEDGVIELKDLGATDLASIVRKIAAAEGGELTLDDAFIEAELARIDAAGRPLYAYFLGQTLARDPARRGWTLEELLDDVLHKDWAQRWRAAFDGAPPEIGEDDPAARLAVIATMCGGVDCTSARALGAPFDSGPKVRRRAITMTDGPTGAGVSTSNVQPLQPDILGEWFVLRSIRDGLPLESVCDGAWRANPNGMARFFERLAQDFPSHESSTSLLDRLPPNERTADAYASVSGSIVFHLHRIKIGIPATLMEMLRRACAAGDGVAMSDLGLCYHTGIGVAKDPREAVRWYRRGAEAGSSSAMAGLGLCYQIGDGVKKDPRGAFRWYRKGAEAGHGWSMACLGLCYETGFGIKEDTREAVRWYRKGAEAGSGIAMAYLGGCYVKGIGVQEDPREAVSWYRKGANTGDGLAMTRLGLCYEAGVGVEKDPREAVRWFRKGAEAGDSESMLYLGLCYEEGIGVEEDLVEAVLWYRKGAEAGSGTAMACLGNCYETGVGVEKDPREAVRWYRKGAEAGNGSSMARLGLCYENGVGVKKDLGEAVRWYRKGAEAGDGLAKSRLASLGDTLVSTAAKRPVELRSGLSK